MIELLRAKGTVDVWLVTGTNDVGEQVKRGFYSEREAIGYRDAWGIK